MSTERICYELNTEYENISILDKWEFRPCVRERGDRDNDDYEIQSGYLYMHKKLSHSFMSRADFLSMEEWDFRGLGYIKTVIKNDGEGQKMDKPREWWIDKHGIPHETEEDCRRQYLKAWGRIEEYFHVIEYSAYEKLKAENYVLRDSQLRTYDGLSEKADKYDELAKVATENSSRLESLEEKVKFLDGVLALYKAKLKICTEALSSIHNRYVQCEDCMAREAIAMSALEKLK